MGVFDNFADNPFNIRTEGQEITLKFTRTGPTSARIGWNIPPPANGCTSDTQAYNGILITLDTIPASAKTVPVNGTAYTSDPTADSNLFSGDKLATSLVIGAFYDDKSTVFVDVTGLQPNAVYYASGYAVDAQLQYHLEGVHAYSLLLSNQIEEINTAGYQIIEFKDNGVPTPIVGTDPTGLVPTDTYTFTLNVDRTEYPIDVLGSDALAFTALLSEIQKDINKFDNPVQNPTPPNTNALYWDNTKKKLYKWDGSQHVLQNCLVEPTQPNSISPGSYWYDLTSNTLKVWDGFTWNNVRVLNYLKDPTMLGCVDYWFNGTNAYLWEGNTWCQKNLYNQINDPSLPALLPCGTHWYNTTNQILNEWVDETNSWKAVNALYWNTDPQSLLPLTYWFDETNYVLKQYSGSIWNIVTATISQTAPTVTTAGMLWFDTANDKLYIRDILNSSWTLTPVIVLSYDPTVRHSCELWWNSVSDLLYVWDVTTLTWKLVTNFIQSAINPYLPPTLTTEDVWFNPSNGLLKGWNGATFVTVNFINTPLDPTVVADGDVWFDNVNNKWYVRNTGTWVLIDPIDSNIDPTILPMGTFWYNSLTNALQSWNGLSWISVGYGTSKLTPTDGTLWYDTSTDTLKVWQKNAWVLATPKAVVSINADGNIQFTSSTLGSSSIAIVSNDELFKYLTQNNIIGQPISGTDAVESNPQYKQPGINDLSGTDERRKLIDDIKVQLGYPTVEVELTKQQLDKCVNLAIETFRQRSSGGYRRGMLFMYVKANQQKMLMTDKRVGFNKIVNIMGLHRISSSFLSTIYSSGVFGQIVLNQLFSVSVFDTLSYFMVAQYVENLEIMLASRLTFSFNEHTRELHIYKIFPNDEVVLVDASFEMTEQQLLSDRFIKPWIEKYATAQARIMLALSVRGKYTTLPGAGGGVQFNNAELITKANEDIEDCMMQIEEYLANNPEEWGSDSTLIIG